MSGSPSPRAKTRRSTSARGKPAAADFLHGERDLKCRTARDSPRRDSWWCRALATSTRPLPAITGKLELEYEGEMKGADYVGRELIRAAIAKTYDGYFKGTDMNQIVQWFDLGGEIQLADTAGAVEALHRLRGIQGLMEKVVKLNVGPKDEPGDTSLRSGICA